MTVLLLYKQAEKGDEAEYKIIYKNIISKSGEGNSGGNRKETVTILFYPNGEGKAEEEGLVKPHFEVLSLISWVLNTAYHHIAWLKPDKDGG